MAYPKNHLSVTTKDFRENYKKTTGSEISNKAYKGFIDDLFYEMFDMMYTERFHITFPNGLGDIYIKTGTPTGYYAENFDFSGTFGKTITVKWDKKFTTFKTSKYYGFKKSEWARIRHIKHKKDIRNGDLPMPEPYEKPLQKYVDLNE